MPVFAAYRPFVGLLAIGLLAIVVLFPKPGVVVRPALARAGSATLDRIAELQSYRVSSPDDVEAALELSDLYLAQWRPDWSLATIAPLAARRPNDFRLQLALAATFADRFDFPKAKQAIDAARAICEGSAADPPCGEPDRIRLGVFETVLGNLVSQGASFQKDPNQVKDIIDHSLLNTRIPDPREPRSPLLLQKQKPPAPAPAKQ
jgi:hypothetical protein